jgi:hypothetical protein
MTFVFLHSIIKTEQEKLSLTGKGEKKLHHSVENNQGEHEIF